MMAEGKSGSPRKDTASLRGWANTSVRWFQFQGRSESVATLASSVYSLCHLHRRFAVYATTTLKTGLVIREVVRSTCERVLLQNPAAPVQRPVQDMTLKVIDHFADI